MKSRKLIDNQELLGMYPEEKGRMVREGAWPKFTPDQLPGMIPPKPRESPSKPQTEGERLRDEGMARAASARKTLLLRAQRLAVSIAEGRESRTCASDDVREALAKEGEDPSGLGNAAGSVFKGDRWTLVATRKSRRTPSHARRIGVWRLS